MSPRSDAETIAEAFHEAYERLAPALGYMTRDASARPWKDVPGVNRTLMIATVQDLLDRSIITGPLDPRHILELAADGWSLQHPVKCRDDLFCEVHKLVSRRMSVMARPPGPPGRYPVRVVDEDGGPKIEVDLVHPIEAVEA